MDPIIKNFEEWVKTIDPNDISIPCGERNLNALDVLQEMKDGTEFGKNFIESIKKGEYKIISSGLQQSSQ